MSIAKFNRDRATFGILVSPRYTDDSAQGLVMKQFVEIDNVPGRGSFFQVVFETHTSTLIVFVGVVHCMVGAIEADLVFNTPETYVISASTRSEPQEKSKEATNARLHALIL